MTRSLSPRGCRRHRSRLSRGRCPGSVRAHPSSWATGRRCPGGACRSAPRTAGTPSALDRSRRQRFNASTTPAAAGRRGAFADVWVLGPGAVGTTRSTLPSRGAVELRQEGRRPRRIGEHRHPVPAPRDRDVEHAPLLLDVDRSGGGASDALGDAEHRDVRPLAALHPVDGGAASTPPAAASRWNVCRSHDSKPAGSGCRVGDLQQALEVVEMGRAVAAAGRVEQRHGAGPARCRRARR